MKLGKKLYIAILVFIIISFGTILYILSSVTSRNFQNVEKEIYEKTMRSVYEIVKADFERYASMLEDYAKWNTTEQYIKGENQNYISNNLNRNTFADNGIDIITIFDEKNTLLFGKRLSSTTKKLETIDSGLVNILRLYNNTSGVIAYNDEYFFFVAREVTDNEGNANVGGKMLFAFYVDEEYIAKVGKKVGSTLTLSSHNNESILFNDKHIVEIADQNKFRMEVIFFQKEDISMGIVSLPVINKIEFFYLKLKLEDSIYELGQRQMFETSLMVISSLSILLIIMSVALRFDIISRIEKVNQQVEEITRNKNINARVVTNGKDEITELSNGINEMLNELKIMHLEVAKQATFDEMTGCYNRRSGYEKIERDIQETEQSEQKITIILIDIDGLKRVNDTYGHACGDQLIVGLVDFISVFKGKDDYIIRMGGDEFLFVVKNKNMKETMKLMEKVEKELINHNKDYEEMFKIQFSYGMETYEKGMKLDVLIESADKKMYKQKTVKRRNREELFDE